MNGVTLKTSNRVPLLIVVVEILEVLKYLLYFLGRSGHKPEEGDRQWTTYMTEVEISVFYYAVNKTENLLSVGMQVI